jgi:hypothetical protein
MSLSYLYFIFTFDNTGIGWSHPQLEVTSRKCMPNDEAETSNSSEMGTKLVVFSREGASGVGEERRLEDRL